MAGVEVEPVGQPGEDVLGADQRAVEGVVRGERLRDQCGRRSIRPFRRGGGELLKRIDELGQGGQRDFPDGGLPGQVGRVEALHLPAQRGWRIPPVAGRNSE